MFVTGHSSDDSALLLQCIGGLQTPDAGSITFEDKEITTFNTKARRLFRRQIGWLFSRPRLIDHLTVEQNILLSLTVAANQYRSDTSRLRSVLEFVGMSNKKALFPSQLSLNEQQLVCLARSIIHSPKMILADNPTSFMSQQEEHLFFERLRILCVSGILVLVSTNHASGKASDADRVLVLEKGQMKNLYSFES
ncbi:MAG: hypothetical protein CMF48_03220 [Legionellales bacterium]|nr:hypothetical protein [Legionellales bacterium]|tara:strand:- start:2367 stop:2948 length:582 start_codon:yes stop_codon:yes gene_type:complete